MSHIVRIYAILFLASGIALRGQEPVSVLNSRILQLHGLIQSAGSTERTQLAFEADPVLQQRFEALRALIQRSPREALLVAFSEELLDELRLAFPNMVSRLETHGAWHGEIEYVVADGVNFKTSESIVQMKSGREEIFLHFASPPPAFKSGDRLAVHGVRAGNRVAVEDVKVLASAPAGVCSTMDAQNLAVILVNLQSYSLPSTMNAGFVRGVMLGNSGGGAQNTPDWSVDDFWRQNSDDRAWVNRSGSGALTVVGPYNLPGNYNAGGSFDVDGLLTAAWTAADPDLNYNSYSRVLVISPPNGVGNWAGLGTLGCSPGICPGDGACNYSWVWQRSDQMWDRWAGVHLTTHELGHNLTMHHSNSRDFGSEALGPFGVLGNNVEYGDPFSTMGGWNIGFYNADHAIGQLGWFTPGTNYLDVSTSGSYSIQWAGRRPAGLKALRIQRGAPTDDAKLIVESRQNRGIYDPTLPSQVTSGALIHYRDSFTGSHTHVLDFTPNSSSGFSDAALAVGQSWTDPYSDLKVKVDSIVNDTLNLTVTYGTTPCTRANPAVMIKPANPTTQAGVPVTYTVTVTNKDAAGCAAATFGLSSTLPAGWPAGAFSPNALTLDPGAFATATFNKTPPVGIGVGTYPVNAIATHAAANRTGTGSASCTVATSSKLSAVLSVPAASYRLQQNVPITVIVKNGGALVSGASVRYTLVRPNGQKVNRTLLTNSNGKTTWNYKPPTKGLFSVTAVATKGALKATSNSDTFTVN
jgi:hypothetical protein